LIDAAFVEVVDCLVVSFASPFLKKPSLISDEALTTMAIGTMPGPAVSAVSRRLLDGVVNSCSAAEAVTEIHVAPKAWKNLKRLAICFFQCGKSCHFNCVGGNIRRMITYSDQSQVMRCISSCTAGEGIQHPCFVQWCVMVKDHTSICLNPVAVLQRVGCHCDCMSDQSTLGFRRQSRQQVPYKCAW
jgi:hypothetical protein